MVQTAIRLIYPPRCALCGVQVESDHALCGTCWRDTPLIVGHCCDACGVPLPGDGEAGDLCDDCLKTPRPWSKGRAAMLYKDNGRKFVLALKHGDRQDLLRPLGKWLAGASGSLLTQDALIAPVPLHWSRLLKRTFNQSALLSRALASEIGETHCPDLLCRPKRTRSLDGMTQQERFAQLEHAIDVHPKRKQLIKGRAILLVDDVMTSGATLSAATHACYAAGAGSVSVVVLARAARDA